MARSIASALVTLGSCARITSYARSLIFSVGLTAFIAPCGSIETTLPRNGRCRALEPLSSVDRSMVSPSISIVPVSTYNGGWAIIASALTSVDLPQPDSPARPRIWPSGTSMVTLSTAGTSWPLSAA